MLALKILFAALLFWFIPLIKILMKKEKLNFYFKNLGICLLVAVCISTAAYVIGGFLCDGNFCEHKFIARSFLISSIVLFVWAIVLTLKKGQKN